MRFIRKKNTMKYFHIKEDYYRMCKNIRIFTSYKSTVQKLFESLTYN